VRDGVFGIVPVEERAVKADVPGCLID